MLDSVLKDACLASPVSPLSPRDTLRVCPHSTKGTGAVGVLICIHSWRRRLCVNAYFLAQAQCIPHEHWRCVRCALLTPSMVNWLLTSNLQVRRNNARLVPPGVCGSWPLLAVWDPRFSWGLPPTRNASVVWAYRRPTFAS